MAAHTMLVTAGAVFVLLLCLAWPAGAQDGVDTKVVMEEETDDHKSTSSAMELLEGNTLERKDEGEDVFGTETARSGGKGKGSRKRWEGRIRQTGRTCRIRPSPCTGGLVCCGYACFNLGTSARHCGKCHNVCESGRVCCSGKCKNLSRDKNNCGSCKRRCAAGETCSFGLCSY